MSLQAGDSTTPQNIKHDVYSVEGSLQLRKVDLTPCFGCGCNKDGSKGPYIHSQPNMLADSDQDFADIRHQSS